MEVRHGQYSVGHLERLQRIESLRQKLPGLALAGNGYSGIGVPDCVRSGSEAAGKILAEMACGPPLAESPPPLSQSLPSNVSQWLQRCAKLAHAAGCYYHLEV